MTASNPRALGLGPRSLEIATRLASGCCPAARFGWPGSPNATIIRVEFALHVTPGRAASTRSTGERQLDLPGCEAVANEKVGCVAVRIFPHPIVEEPRMASVVSSNHRPSAVRAEHQMQLLYGRDRVFERLVKTIAQLSHPRCVVYGRRSSPRRSRTSERWVGLVFHGISTSTWGST